MQHHQFYFILLPTVEKPTKPMAFYGGFFLVFRRCLPDFYRLPLGKSLLARDWLTSSSHSSHHFALLFVLLPFMLCCAVLCYAL